MTEQRRATFQRTNIHDDGTVIPCFSININRTQAIVAVLVGIITIIGSAVGAVSWTRGVITEVSIQTFERALNDYHAIARPKLEGDVNNMIEQAIHKHQLEVMPPFEGRLTGIQAGIAANNAKIDHLIEEAAAHRKLLDELLSRTNDNGNR